MKIERRNFQQVEVRAVQRDDGTSAIIGHAAVFDMLSDNLGGFRERVAPGAFAETIESDDIRALWNHNPDHVLGRNVAGTLKLSEDERGLSIEIEPPDTQTANDLMKSIQRGDVSQMSFGFRVQPDGEEWYDDPQNGIVRTLKRVRLFDVSPVTYPAYPQTDVATRSLDLWKQSQGQAEEERAAEAAQINSIKRLLLDLHELA